MGLQAENEKGQALWQAPDHQRLKGDRALPALLLACALPGAPGSGVRYLGLGFPYRSILADHRVAFCEHFRVPIKFPLFLTFTEISNLGFG